VRSVDDHLAECLAAVGPLPPLDVELFDAADCLLVEDVVAPVSLPSFDNSAMDGYAVQAADVARAGDEAPITLPVVGDLPAGSGEHLRLTQGTAIRIMTGAPLPDGADSVVPVEDTDAGVARVQIRRPAAEGAYLRRVGEDVRAGDVVLRAGVRLSPRHLGLLAAIGRDRVLVRPRPRVVVVSTGSELVDPGRPLGFGQIHDSNAYLLAAAATELGAVATRVGPVEDDAQVFLSTLEDQLGRADLVVTSGGVSAGAFDTVKEVLRELGTVTFTKVAMQPGMPQGFGSLTALGGREVPIFTLPGNPVSSAVSFEVFVRPVIRKMRGEETLHRHAVRAAATRDWRSPEGKRQFVRAVLERRLDGHHQVTPVGGQGSHLVADLAHATCLAVVPEGVGQVRAGDLLDCLLLDRARR
jgi:molybdopterin molybdotransferase